jgi:hypothetical protein
LVETAQRKSQLFSFLSVVAQILEWSLFDRRGAGGRVDAIGNDRNFNVLDMEKDKEKKKAELTKEQCEKLSDWGERAALVGLSSLVIQQIVNGAPITQPSILVGIGATALVYYASYRLLKRAK